MTVCFDRLENLIHPLPLGWIRNLATKMIAGIAVFDKPIQVALVSAIVCGRRSTMKDRQDK